MSKREKPTDVLDRYLNQRTPIYNKFISEYIELYGKSCTFYINPNHEGSESEDSPYGDRPDNLEEKLDNYTLAYGKDNVGFDYSKMEQKDATILADYQDFYKHDIGADEQVQYYLQVKGTPISRGDIISYKVQNKLVFYRIVEIMNSYMEIVYRINCRLIQVKQINNYVTPFDVILPEGTVIL